MDRRDRRKRNLEDINKEMATQKIKLDDILKQEKDYTTKNNRKRMNLKDKKETPEIINVEVDYNNKEKSNVKFSKKYAILFTSLLIVISLASITTVSYSLFTKNVEVEKNYSMTVGTLDFKIENEENSISLLNAYPMTDGDGKDLTPYKFTIHNTGNIVIDYKIHLIEDEARKNSCNNCEFLEKDRLKIELKENGVVILDSVLLSDIDYLVSQKVAGGVSNNYELKIWLDYENTTIDDVNKYYYGKLSVTGVQESTNVLSGTYINIMDGKDTEIDNIKVYGNTVNDTKLASDGILNLTITGKNLMKAQGYSTPKTDTDFWYKIAVNSSPLNDGWLNFNCINTDSKMIFLDFYLTKNALSKITESNRYTYYYELVNNINDGNNSYKLGHNPDISFFGFTREAHQFSSGKYVMYLTSKSDFTSSIMGLKSYIGFSSGSSINLDIRAMLLYGEVALEDVGEYEHYKERTYAIPLKDTSNQTINGLGTGDSLQKVNGTYAIIKNDGSIVTLSNETQDVLNSIRTYDGTSNIFIDEEINPTNIEIKYFSKII